MPFGRAAFFCAAGGGVLRGRESGLRAGLRGRGGPVNGDVGGCGAKERSESGVPARHRWPSGQEFWQILAGSRICARFWAAPSRIVTRVQYSAALWLRRAAEMFGQALRRGREIRAERKPVTRAERTSRCERTVRAERGPFQPCSDLQ